MAMILKGQNVLDSLGVKPFQPHKLLRHPLSQTLIPHFLPSGTPLKKTRINRVPLSDGDALALSEYQPENYISNFPSIVLIHGLAGCEESTYIIRLSKKLFSLGFKVYNLNLRSCGPGRGWAQKPYHCGRSEDTFAVLKWLEQNRPQEKIIQTGFSLSANITIKMVGSEPCEELKNLDSCVAVSPPLNLNTSSVKIVNGSFKIFDKYFLRKLKKEFKILEKDLPHAKDFDFKKVKNMMDFDQNYTAPHSGFDSAQDYYNKASGLNFIPNIKVSTLLLHSIDDPVSGVEGFDEVKKPNLLKIIETQKGGHVGFLSKDGSNWADQVIIKWIHNRANLD